MSPFRRQSTQPPPVDPDLLREIHALRRRLNVLLAQARQNEEKLRRHQAFELRMIACTGLSELIRLVVEEYRASKDLERVTLYLIDPEYELRRILEDEGELLEPRPELIFSEDPAEMDTVYGARLQPRLGAFDDERHRVFFPGPHPPASVALLPLVRRGRIIGSLNLGSAQASRYQPGVGTDFLERLALFTAVCLENVTNHERLKRVGLTDVLTGVNNRRFFDQRLVEAVAQARRATRPLSCLFIDVDHFKRVNDRHGHHVGDQVLHQVAGLIRECLRTSDVLARYGGEEFAALLLEAGEDEAREIAERVRRRVAAQRFLGAQGESLGVTVSIGVATLHPGGVPGDDERLGRQLVELADACVYRAKGNGRDRVEYQALGTDPSPP